jgi:hypothetical protein
MVTDDEFNMRCNNHGVVNEQPIPHEEAEELQHEHLALHSECKGQTFIRRA